MRIVGVSSGDPRIASFHRGIYWDEFAAQHEPLACWERALRGEAAYELTLRLAIDGDDAIVGGICFERYPQSRAGLITYMAVAQAARGHGLGRQLQREAVAALLETGAPAVFGEVNDPRITTLEPADVAWHRLERNQRWGARVVDARYIQPALAPGLTRDRELVLIALADDRELPATLPGAVVRDFVDELYAVTEHGPRDPDIAIGDTVALVELRR